MKHEKPLVAVAKRGVTSQSSQCMLPIQVPHSYAMHVVIAEQNCLHPVQSALRIMYSTPWEPEKLILV